MAGSNDNVAEKKLAEILEKTGGKFDKTEVNDFINMGKRISGKPVLSALKEVILDGPRRGLDAAECERLCAKIDSLIEYKDCGYVQINFRETTMILHVCLSLVDKDYKTEVDIPSRDYINDLFDKYDFLKKTAIAFWHTFMEENPKLIKRISEYRPDIDFGNLTIDPLIKTSLYWDAECPKRVGIFAYYVSADGKLYYKKSGR